MRRAGEEREHARFGEDEDLIEKSAHDALKKARSAFLSKTGMEFLAPPWSRAGENALFSRRAGQDYSSV